MRTVATTTSMKPGTSGKKGGNTQKAYNAGYKTKCAMIAHFVSCLAIYQTIKPFSPFFAKSKRRI